VLLLADLATINSLSAMVATDAESNAAIWPGRTTTSGRSSGKIVVTVVCVRTATLVYLVRQSGYGQARGIAGGSTVIGADI
jgi:hypothetical protein